MEAVQTATIHTRVHEFIHSVKQFKLGPEAELQDEQPELLSKRLKILRELENTEMRDVCCTSETKPEASLWAVASSIN